MCVCLPMPIWSAVHMHASAEVKSWFLVSSFITLHLVFQGSFSFSQELAIWLSWLASKAHRYFSSLLQVLSVQVSCHLTWSLQVCFLNSFFILVQQALYPLSHPKLRNLIFWKAKFWDSFKNLCRAVIIFLNERLDYFPILNMFYRQKEKLFHITWLSNVFPLRDKTFKQAHICK